MPVSILLQWTPNPSTLKYQVDCPVLPSGAMSFTEPQVAERQSPLAKKLMDIRGVTAVMLGTSFVTVTKGQEGDWDELNEAVMATLEAHLSAGEPVVNPEALVRPPVEGASAVESRIREILEAEIRPALAMDGGDITLERFEDGIAYVNMRGACSGCPSSSMTLKMGIEGRLRESIPELSEVVAI